MSEVLYQVNILIGIDEDANGDYHRGCCLLNGCDCGTDIDVFTSKNEEIAKEFRSDLESIWKKTMGLEYNRYGTVDYDFTNKEIEVRFRKISNFIKDKYGINIYKMIFNINTWDNTVIEIAIKKIQTNDSYYIKKYCSIIKIQKWWRELYYNK